MSERISDTIQRATIMLRAAGVEAPERDAQILLAHVMGVDQTALITRMNEPLPPSVLLAMDRVIALRALRQPVSHIIGKRAFWNHEFLVNADVLDPRPDTEALVAAALELPFETVLDLGTGSGAIIISLLSERPQAMGVATDISPKALDIARCNASRIGVADRVRFEEANWFGGLFADRFDLIVSNPPYISETEMEDLAPEVRDWEPLLALTPGGDGLAAYRLIAANLRDYLTPNGHALFEIGFSQAADVKDIFTQAGFTSGEVIEDLSGHDRVVIVSMK